MARLWQLFWYGHAHKWKIIKNGPRTLQMVPSGKVVPNGYYYDLQCETCGIVRTKNT